MSKIEKLSMATTMAVIKKMKETGRKTSKNHILTAQNLRELKKTPKNPLQQFRRYK